MSELILSPTLTEKAVAVRNSLAGIGALVELRPDTLALIEGGLRVQTMLNAIAGDLEVAEVLVIDSPDMLAEAQTLNGRIAALCADSGAIEKERKALTSPFGDLTKLINTGYGELREHLAGAKDRLSWKILDYNKEQRRLQAEADERARRERERLAQVAAEKEREAKAAADKLVEQARAEQAAGNEEAAQTLVTEASVAIDAGRQAVRQATLDMHSVSTLPVGGAKAKGVRTVWKSVLTDHEKLILHVAERIQAGDKSLMHLIPYDESAGTRKAAAEKEAFNVPGLRADCNDALSVRKAAVAA